MNASVHNRAPFHKKVIFDTEFLVIFQQQDKGTDTELHFIFHLHYRVFWAFHLKFNLIRWAHFKFTRFIAKGLKDHLLKSILQDKFFQIFLNIAVHKKLRTNKSWSDTRVLTFCKCCNEQN